MELILHLAKCQKSIIINIDGEALCKSSTAQPLLKIDKSTLE